MNIIIRGKYSEKVRRQVDVAKQNLAGYYREECKKGSQFFSKLPKGVIKKVYEHDCNPDAMQARDANSAGRAASDSS